MYTLLSTISGHIPGIIPRALAQGSIDPCPLEEGLLPCPGSAADVYIISTLGNGLMVAFVGMLFAMIVYYGFKLVAGSDNDSTLTEVYNAYGHAAIGTILAGGAFFFASSFAVPGQLLNTDPTEEVVFNVALAIRALLAAALFFNVTYQGYRLLTSQDEGQVAKAKKQFIYGMVGAIIVMLAEVMALAFSVGSGGSGSNELSIQAIGIANFVGGVLGTLSVVALFMAGMFLVFAINEQYKDRAKKVIMTAFVVLSVTMMSLALIRVTFSAAASL